MDDGGDGFDIFTVDDDGDISAFPKPAAKFQPRLKGKVQPKPETSTEQCSSQHTSSFLSHSVKKQEDAAHFMAVDGVEEFPAVGSIAKENGGAAVEADGGAPMDVDAVDKMEEEDDVVVKEIDVFFNPSPIDVDTQLYVVQYPLRPFWRPYGLEERCHDVRVKPKKMEVEFDLFVDTDGENYNDEVDEHLSSKIQTLSSSKVPLVTSYAVGILKQNQLHLNPVHAVVQLRPSMEYLKSSRLQNRKSALNAAGTSVDMNQTNEEDHSKPSTSEAWVSLQFHSTEDAFSGRYRQKMAADEDGEIQFTMDPHEYLNNLCPVVSHGNDRPKGPSKELLLSMPLEERLKVLFKEGPQVHRFGALMHLAPTCSEGVVLKLLPQYADLVQGLWVSKSSLLFEGIELLARDYVLLLFSKSSMIPCEKLKRIKADVLTRIMNPLARQRPSLKDWKFKEPTDLSFIKGHPQVVKDMESDWSTREKRIMYVINSGEKLSKERKKPSSANPIPASSNVNHGPVGVKDLSKRLTTKTLSDEAREAVPKAIVKVLENHKACSLSTIQQKLREMALAESALPNSRTSISAVLGFIASLKDPKELNDIISHVAVQVHGVYVLKSVGNEKLDSLRGVIISLYQVKEPKAKVKKDEILAALSQRIVSIKISDCNQVLRDLCVCHRGGTWSFKSGDGEPD